MQNELLLHGGVDQRAHAKPRIWTGGYDLQDDEIIVDSFAGAGGMSTGIEWATGRAPDIAINHDPIAIGTHEANHPFTTHYSASVYALDPEELVAGRKVGIFWASPDCFTEGTLVLTREGLKPIETIKVGEMVLTHKNRWRPVIKAWTQVSDTVEVKGYGHYGLITTPRHTFYSKLITYRYPGKNKKTGKRPGTLRTLVENPYWPEARRMKGKLWATPHSFPEVPIPICKGASFSESFFYFVGRWLGDGTINKGDVEICAGLKEASDLEQIFIETPLEHWDGRKLDCRIVDRKTTIAFVWGNAPLVRWLEENFGKYSHGKKLPVWALSMQRSWRESLFRGYLDADGHDEQRRTIVSSISKELAVGFKLLASTLGHTASLGKAKGGPCVIEGREVIARDRYSVSWTRNLQRETTFSDTVHRYTKVKKVTDSGEYQVYCLEVKEDESFVADGIVVHNCRSHSRARGSAPKSKAVRDLAWVVVHWAEKVRPRIIGLENVQEFVKWCPLDENGKAIKGREGETFREWVGRLGKLGYAVEWRILNAADFGAPTKRNRLFLQARCDGLPILWPDQTHGDPSDPRVDAGEILPWRTAAECIDYSLPAPSIFLSKEEGKALGCKRPLAEKTMRRIARGIFRHVLGTEKPFLVEAHKDGVIIPLTHQGDDRCYSPGEPFRTITGANRGEMAWVAPFFARTAHGDVCSKGKKRGKGDHGATEPYPTITASNDSALICPTLIQTGYGERLGQDPRSLNIHQPLGTVVAGGVKHAVVNSTLSPVNGTSTSQPDRSEEVAEFLWKWRQLSDKPVTRDSLGILHIDGKPLRITDIGLRMLVGNELAKAQGFDLDEFDPTIRVETRNGKKVLVKNTATKIIKMIGNSVAPPCGAAVIRAMIGDGTDSKGRRAQEVLQKAA